MRVVLWRHGQTDWNVINRFQGHTDIPLNAVGVFQAEHAARILAEMKPTKIISSDLTRAFDTAQTLASILGLEVVKHSGLRETAGGKWEGHTGAENRAADGERFTQWMTGSDLPAGEIGERRSEVSARALAAVEEALTEDIETLIVVAHGGTIRCLLGGMLGLPIDQWGILGGLANASWSVLEPSHHLKSENGKRRWSLIEHNAGQIPEPVIGDEINSW
jgi:probable phosphoglycerate mutase